MGRSIGDDVVENIMFSGCLQNFSNSPIHAEMFGAGRFENGVDVISELVDPILIPTKILKKALALKVLNEPRTFNSSGAGVIGFHALLHGFNRFSGLVGNLFGHGWIRLCRVTDPVPNGVVGIPNDLFDFWHFVCRLVWFKASY